MEANRNYPALDFELLDTSLIQCAFLSSIPALAESLIARYINWLAGLGRNHSSVRSLRVAEGVCRRVRHRDAELAIAAKAFAAYSGEAYPLAT